MKGVKRFMEVRVWLFIVSLIIKVCINLAIVSGKGKIKGLINSKRVLALILIIIKRIIIVD